MVISRFMDLKATANTGSCESAARCHTAPQLLTTVPRLRPGGAGGRAPNAPMRAAREKSMERLLAASVAPAARWQTALNWLALLALLGLCFV
jgi:hypothetical protein